MTDLMLPTDPAAIIFDLDGTLLDTEPLYTIATQKVLDPYGHQFTPELKRRIMGGDSIVSAQITIDEFNLPLTPQQFLAARESHLLSMFPEAPEIEGAGRYVMQTAAQQIPMGLATSSHRHLCDLKISHRHWHQHFRTIVCGDDAALTRSKPAPDIFLLCAERMGADPGSVLAFEDSGNGIAAAKAAGMTVVALRSPFTTDEDLGAADLIIDTYNQLLQAG